VVDRIGSGVACDEVSFSAVLKSPLSAT
jgi:hypothetical protein